MTPRGRARRWLLGGVAALFLVGCGLPAFTTTVRSRFNMTPAEIQRLQFYTSGDILLRREILSQERVTSNNTVLVGGGVTIEEVLIPLKTPGVVIRVEGEFVLVSFSREHPDRSLWFTVKRKEGDLNPLAEKRYELVHLENAHNEPPPFTPRFAKGFQITYGGQKYQLADGRMWEVFLLYEDGGYNSRKLKEQPPGWKLSDGESPRAGIQITTQSSASVPAGSP